MKLDSKQKAVETAKEEALKILETEEDKSKAIIEAMEKLTTAQHAGLIAQLQNEATKAQSDAEFRKTLNLRTLTEKETKFYETLCAKQSITAELVDIFPETIIDRTLENVKEPSGVLSLIDMAPAGVTKWLVADKTGKAVWGNIFGGIDGKITTKIETLNAELGKMTVYMVIPKAIKDLALPFVDKYFTSVLNEIINDGLEEAFLIGNGVEQPIGIYKQIGAVEADGKHKDKKSETITSFTPKSLAPVKKTLSNNGKRTFDRIVLVCNPADEADYIAPAIYNDEGRLIASYKNLEVMPSANNPLGKAAFVLPKKYTMAFSGIKINEYDQTKAMDDANLLIAKLYGNGRAVDDNCAVVIDVTKLEEYIQRVRTIAGA